MIENLGTFQMEADSPIAEVLVEGELSPFEHEALALESSVSS